MATLTRQVITKLLIPVGFRNTCYRCLSTRLAEVGVLEKPRDHGKSYETGQLFLHKIFGYRGIVLFPWIARMYDRDLTSKTEERALDEQAMSVGKEVKGRNHLYYQVLIDARDCPHIRAQTEAVTFLGNHENSRALYAIPGLDYVAHEDLLPYTTEERIPIQHELFEKFLMSDPESREFGTVKWEDLRKW